jgi:segregation and condensation protein B
MNEQTETSPEPVEVKADAAPIVPPPADETELQRRLEAVLISVDRPQSPAKLASATGAGSAKDVAQAIEFLNDFYQQHQRSFRIEHLAGGYQIMTQPEFRPVLAALHHAKDDGKLSPAALETLAIIAYKQPIQRVDIESIRGVSCGEVVRTLMEKHLVKIVGRAEELGRPMLYGTTKTFLEVFGLSNLKDLPKAEELIKP